MLELTGLAVVIFGSVLAVWINDCTPWGGKELYETQPNAILINSGSLPKLSGNGAGPRR